MVHLMEVLTNGPTDRQSLMKYEDVTVFTPIYAKVMWYGWTFVIGVQSNLTLAFLKGSVIY